MYDHGVTSNIKDVSFLLFVHFYLGFFYVFFPTVLPGVHSYKQFFQSVLIIIIKIIIISCVRITMVTAFVNIVYIYPSSLKDMTVNQDSLQCTLIKCSLCK